MIIPWLFIFVCLSWANAALFVPHLSWAHPPGAAFGGIWLQVAMSIKQKDQVSG
ncbi:hypothetical protein ABZT47_15625 [Sphaerisporangium sp. NPDC005289]|uniref:hypothetical protein n=1 Tax=Sphaerisporangium sp. NPDC005289 TaxID=3155247 RepID=UPI0033B4680F